MADDIQGAADEMRARVVEGSTPKRSPPAWARCMQARERGEQAPVDLIRTGQGERGEVTHDVTDAAAATREREKESKQSERKERERERVGDAAAVMVWQHTAQRLSNRAKVRHVPRPKPVHSARNYARVRTNGS